MFQRPIIMISLLVAPAAAQADGYGFTTPSRNIFCNGSVEDGYIDCTIVERSGPPAQPRSRSCAGFWGHSVQLAATGPARFICDAKAPKRVSYTDIAGYGQTGQFGPITCQSERTGLTCRNQTGNGFFLSRRNQHAD